MKAGDLIDVMMELDSVPVVVELANGNKVPVHGYRYGENAKGEPIVVLIGKGHAMEGANTG